LSLQKVPSIPDGAREERQSASIIVGHSETGHHHSIDDVNGVRFFYMPEQPLVCYLMLEGTEHADVVHHRPFDAHETLRLLATPGEKTVFEVRHQREYREAPAPRAWTPVRD
jgi:hypothetical protein